MNQVYNFYNEKYSMNYKLILALKILINKVNNSKN